VPEQPAPACRWLDIWHKAKSHIWLFHVASVVLVKQQDGDKKDGFALPEQKSLKHVQGCFLVVVF
jgi:hypothetical protein